jgi:hypothetical protein
MLRPFLLARGGQAARAFPGSIAHCNATSDRWVLKAEDPNTQRKGAKDRKAREGLTSRHKPATRFSFAGLSLFW